MGIPALPPRPFSPYCGRWFTHKRQEEREFAGSSRVLGQTPFSPRSWPFTVAMMSGECTVKASGLGRAEPSGADMDNVAPGL